MSTPHKLDSLGYTGRMLVAGLFLLLAWGSPSWSAISPVASTAVVASGNVDELTLTYPAGLVTNDILIAQVTVRGNRTLTPPAGWALIDRSNNGSLLTQAVYWRRADGTPLAPATWGFSGSDRAAGTMAAYRNVDPVVPVNAFSDRSNAASTSVTAGSLTPTVAGTYLVGLFAQAHGNAAYTPPAGMTEQQDDNTKGGNNGIALELADEAYAGGTAATGTRVAGSSDSAASIAHLVALQPNVIAHYRMDEASWSGVAGGVLDSSGRSHHATALNGAASGGATPAIPGSPGTCNHGIFDGSNDYVALPSSFPNLVTDFTITAWIRTTNNAKSGQRILIDDQNNTQGYGFSLGDGGAGRIRFYTRSVNPIILDTPNVIQNNTWYFVAAVASMAAKTKSIYVYSQAGAQLAFVTQGYTGTWGTDAGAASIGGENAASTENSSNFRFSGNLDEVSVYSGALGPTALQAVMSQVRPCSVTPPVVPSGFNAFETSTAPGSVSGVIRTQLAGSAFNLDVVALKTGGAAIETTFAGDVKLELVDASAGASCGGYPLIRSLGTLGFTASDSGRKTLTGINEPNAWPNARVRVTYPATGTPTLVACSSDNFAIRPASLGNVSVSDADSLSAGTARALVNMAANGGVVHRAGRPFRIAATAFNANGAATGNYAGTPVASLTTCLLPATGCTPGVLDAGTWSAAAGTVTTVNASYSEAGAFAMKLVDTSFADVDVADSSVAERHIESAAVTVGRFVPDHFDLTPASVPQFKTFNDTTCATRTFTYVGQPFGYLSLPQATITARNAAGATTLNYAGALWKLVPAGVTQTYSAVTGVLDTGLVGVPVVAETGSGTGTLVPNAADVIAFLRSTPVAPFTASISLAMDIFDSSENAVPGNGTIDTAVPALFADMAFDSGADIRFGRLALTNAHGSELLGLPVPIETQFWNGSSFVRNTADACTQLAAGQVALTNWRRDLNACETSVTLSGRFKAGRGTLRFSAPGAGNTGSVDLALHLGPVGSGNTCVGGVAAPAAGAVQSWLQGQWTGGAFDQNPTARASFGLYRGSKSLIYMREMY